MTLTGKAAEEFAMHAAQRSRQLREEALADARREADATGKERFDLAKLEAMCDTSREGRVDPEPVRWARFEESYYVDYPEIRTLKEFAAKLEELNRWG